MKIPRRMLSAVSGVALVGLLGLPPSIYSCTIFNVTHGGKTYVGANEDWVTDRFNLQVRPSAGTDYGMFIFGVGDPEAHPFFGFNDQGLFFDLASAPQPQKLRTDPGKETWDSRIYVRMLAACSNVAEAVAFLARFNLSGLQRHHIMVVDRDGASAVIEGSPDGQVVIRKSGRHQLITNFLLSTVKDPELLQSGRYAVAERMLTELGEPTLEALRAILRETRNSGFQYPTVFSSILDLSRLRLHLYRKGRFDQGAVIDMRRELQRGKSLRRLSSFF